jgi:hypothetical protein
MTSAPPALPVCPAPAVRASPTRLARLRPLLAAPGFRRLFATRLVAQAGDGVFLMSLAGAVLFNPDTQPHAAAIARGFAILLLPYSLIGPFAGVFLDRLPRQRILLVANLVRLPLAIGVAVLLLRFGSTSLPLDVGALVLLSTSRFVLSALSASLPSTVPCSLPPTALVTANALVTTSGTVAATLGGGAALLLRALLGAGDGTYAVIACCAGGIYACAGLLAGRLDRASLGPAPGAPQPLAAALRGVAHGLVGGARHLGERRPAAHALAVIGAHRLCYGISTVSTLLLYRYYFHPDDGATTGLGGLAVVATATSLGYAAAALLTPRAVGRFGRTTYVTALLAGAAVAELSLGLPFRESPLVLAAFFLGLASQAIKITVDTIVQETVAEPYRGRVFALYDTLFNVTFVAACAVAALVVPLNGRSTPVVLAIGAGYTAAAVAYRRAARRHEAVTRVGAPTGEAPELAVAAR